MFTEDEFDSVVTVNGKKEKFSSKEINETYNDDRFNPRDGELAKASDSLARFIEASVAIQNGSASPDLQCAKLSVKKQFEKVNIANINFGELYADFD